MEIDKILNPFKDSVIHVFNTMLNLEPLAEDAINVLEREITSDITGTIGVIGDITGTASVRFPRALACRIASLMMGTEIHEINNVVKDAIGEIANMVTGGAKGILIQLHEISYKLAIPTVILGSDHTLSYPTGITVKAIPFIIDDQKFYLEICLKNGE
ncbi:MAG: chemotaxis protein CheX [Candidatus Aureabacteria bacterium]|nr:chemotaxis protein CheX [Candidatus Auribacterota bacterium]